MEFNNNKSIFLQIADNITEKVVNGTFPPGEKIPSVRELAADLGVNPNTIMRTYNELQAMKIIDNKRGIGFFVNPDARETILEQKKSEFFDHVLPQFLHQAKLVGISIPELKKHIDKLN
ncbi:MAG: GntR family transcriptional regulator [Bacteroidetes bacterium]|nr:GntR family transcriptional regulator [Bacteroidota bacterium]MDA1119670.1 GntR family transcriptional regulator [Bacteroidota bacterium]